MDHYTIRRYERGETGIANRTERLDAPQLTLPNNDSPEVDFTDGVPGTVPTRTWISRSVLTLMAFLLGEFSGVQGVNPGEQTAHGAHGVENAGKLTMPRGSVRSVRSLLVAMPFAPRSGVGTC